MPEIRINTYEGLFLFPQAAIGDLRATVDHLREILSRADAEIISLGKWDERRLAYDVKGNKRGLYMISYFKAATDKLVGIERDCNLSERILRAMIVRADNVPAELMMTHGDTQKLEDEIKLREDTAAAEASGESAPKPAPAPKVAATPAATPAAAPEPASTPAAADA